MYLVFLWDGFTSFLTWLVVSLPVRDEPTVTSFVNQFKLFSEFCTFIFKFETINRLWLNEKLTQTLQNFLMNSCTSNTLEMVCFDYFIAIYSCCRHAIERLHFTMRAKNKLDIAYHWKTSETSFCMMGNRLNAAFSNLIDITLCWICNMRLCSSVSVWSMGHWCLFISF